MIVRRRSPMKTIQSREKEAGLGKYKDSNEEKWPEVMRKSKEHRASSTPGEKLFGDTEHLLLLM